MASKESYKVVNDNDDLVHSMNTYIYISAQCHDVYVNRPARRAQVDNTGAGAQI